MPLIISPNHRTFFLRCYPRGIAPVQGPLGDPPQEYLQAVRAAPLPAPYNAWQGRRLSRDELLRICDDPSVSDIQAFACVMAWGRRGMRHFKSALLNSIP